jgi:hypothetical protein
MSCNPCGSSSAPPTPDYAGAAQATAAGNADAARIAAKANRIDTYTPYGSQVFRNGVGGDKDRWSVTQTFTPLGQQQFDQQQRINSSLNGLAENGLGYVKGALSKGFDWGALPEQQVNAGQTGQDAIMSRLQPQFDRDEAALDTKLANQGIMQGSEAWNNAKDQFGRTKNDAYTQAALRGIDVGNQARTQAIQEQSFARNEPLNMLNALRSGNQVQQWGAQATTPGADYLGAMQGVYNGQLAGFNANQARQNGIMGGLFDLGAAYLGK